MSYSFRERLRIKLKQKQIQATEEEIQNIEKHIEEYCTEADKRCQLIDPNKAVDEVIDNMSDEKFCQFAKSVLDEVAARKEKLKQKKKKKTKQQEEQTKETEESQTQQNTEETKQEEKPIEATA